MAVVLTTSGATAALNDHFDVSRTFNMGLATGAQVVGGTVQNEIAYTSYARQTISAPTDFGAAVGVGSTNGCKVNKQITFPQVDTGTTLQTATDWFLVESVSGLVWWAGTITDPVGGITIDDNVTPQFDANQIECYYDNPA